MTAEEFRIEAAAVAGRGRRQMRVEQFRARAAGCGFEAFSGFQIGALTMLVTLARINLRLGDIDGAAAALADAEAIGAETWSAPDQP